MQLHKIIISTMFAIVIIAGMITFYGDVNTTSPTYTTDYDNNTFAQLGKANIDEIANITNSTQNKLEAVKQLPAGLDILGGVVVSGFAAVNIALQSFDTIGNMFKALFDLLPIGDGLRGVLWAAISISLLVVGFIGILAHVARPSDRL